MHVNSDYLSLYTFLICTVQHVHGYCKGIGANPGFNGPPLVQQINLTAVLVSWEGLATRTDCADQFLVKSGFASAPNDYELSALLPTDQFKVVIYNRTPQIEYYYQVIAREEKGWKGVDYNKSPETIFATSRRNVDLPVDRVPTTQPPPRTHRPTPPQPANPTTTVWAGSAGPNSSPVQQYGQSPADAPQANIEPRHQQGQDDFVHNYLVWIVIGSLVLLLILVGLVYNLRRRWSSAKSIELESHIGDRDVDDLEADFAEVNDSDAWERDSSSDDDNEHTEEDEDSLNKKRRGRERFRTSP